MWDKIRAVAFWLAIIGPNTNPTASGHWCSLKNGLLEGQEGTDFHISPTKKAEKPKKGFRLSINQPGYR